MSEEEEKRGKGEWREFNIKKTHWNVLSGSEVL